MVDILYYSQMHVIWMHIVEYRIHVECRIHGVLPIGHSGTLRIFVRDGVTLFIVPWYWGVESPSNSQHTVCDPVGWEAECMRASSNQPLRLREQEVASQSRQPMWIVGRETRPSGNVPLGLSIQAAPQTDSPTRLYQEYLSLFISIVAHSVCLSLSSVRPSVCSTCRK